MPNVPKTRVHTTVSNAYTLSAVSSHGWCFPKLKDCLKEYCRSFKLLIARKPEHTSSELHPLFLVPTHGRNCRDENKHLEIPLSYGKNQKKFLSSYLRLVAVLCNDISLSQVQNLYTANYFSNKQEKIFKQYNIAAFLVKMKITPLKSMWTVKI